MPLGPPVLYMLGRIRELDMMNKVMETFDEAVADVPDGAVIMIGNFAGPGGFPYYLIHALRKGNR